MPNYNTYVKTALAKLTIDDVNRAIRKHLRADRMQIVAVAKDAEGLRAKCLSADPSTMTYNAPKPAEVMAEDKIVEKWNLTFRPEDIHIVPVDRIFQ